MKTLIVIAIAALSASIGESCLSYGMRRHGEIDLSNLSDVVTLVLSVIRNPYVFLGVFFLAIFFFLYLAALSWEDLSYVLPLTAMSYLFAALIAKFVLREHVTAARWIGTVVIVIGIACVALEKKRDGETETLRHGKREKQEALARTSRNQKAQIFDGMTG